MLTGPVGAIYFIFSVENTGKWKNVCACVFVCVACVFVCVCTHCGVCCTMLEESLGPVGDLYHLLLFIVLHLSHKANDLLCSTHMYTHTLERVRILSLG